MKNLSCVILVLAVLVSVAVGDLDADQKECGEKLSKVTMCFDYVQGKVKSPSPDCCTNLKKVREDSPKCLCLLLKDSTSPALGFSINQTLAMQLPGSCGVDADVTKCPALLGLSPSSPDARIFENPLKSTNTSSTAKGGSTPTSVKNDSSSGRTIVINVLVFLGLGLSSLTAFVHHF